ncbi:YbhB/YbcL family Raf kinase inhibitor-like protein [Vibrio navarrensis]|nr:YbhB/YbcL family Raf kinase inhibitor-like protein [Vibrio navarrensis]
MKTLLTTALAVSTFCSASAMAATFTLTSQDIAEGHKMHRSFEYAGFGCQGDNLSPQLSWQNVPEGTKSFAITAYDPDAPTGSGWWHWSVIMCGYQSTERFTQRFRQRFGLTPREYLKTLPS